MPNNILLLFKVVAKTLPFRAEYTVNFYRKERLGNSKALLIKKVWQ